jgi:hypothetical protein
MTKKTEQILKELADSLKSEQSNFDPMTEGVVEGAIRSAINDALWTIGDRLSEILEESKSWNDEMETIDDEDEPNEPIDEWQLHAETNGQA